MGLFDFFCRKRVAEPKADKPVQPEPQPIAQPEPQPIAQPEPQRPTPEADTDWTMEENFNYACEISDYITLDVETTGLSSANNRIIEFAAVKVESGKVVDTLSSLVNPGQLIPSNISKLTGITNSDVCDAPCFADVAAKLMNFIGDNYLVGHNIKFDARFLEKELERAGYSFYFECIDTLAMARAAYPEFQNFKLKTLIKNLNLSADKQAHRALSDALCTQLLFESCKIRLVELREAAFRKLINDAEKYAEEDKGYKLQLVGEEYENRDMLDEAVSYYERAIAAGFDGDHPFYRLSVIYRKRKDWLSDLRVCKQALSQSNPHAYDRQKIVDYWQKRIDSTIKKLNR